MTDEGRDRAIAAIWKGIERLAGAIERLSDRLIDQAKSGYVPPKSEKPEQPPLPGMPDEDWQPPEIEVKPREWCNTVRVLDVLHKEYGTGLFSLSGMVEDEATMDAINEATNGKVGVASFSKILSVLVRAGAVERRGRFGYIMAKEPTDELREAVEQMAKKRAAAKEVSA